MISFENYKLNEGKATLLPDEGDGFAGIFHTIVKKINEELEELCNKDYSNSDKQWYHDRAGVIISFIKKDIVVKGKYLKCAIDDLNNTLKDENEKKLYKSYDLFKCVDDIRDALEDFLNIQLSNKNTNLNDFLYYNDEFLDNLNKAYKNYNKAANSK